MVCIDEIVSDIATDRIKIQAGPSVSLSPVQKTLILHFGRSTEDADAWVGVSERGWRFGKDLENGLRRLQVGRLSDVPVPWQAARPEAPVPAEASAVLR